MASARVNANLWSMKRINHHFLLASVETEILVKTTRKPISQKFWNLKQETVYWHKKYSQQLSMMNMAGVKQKYQTTWLVDEEKVSHDTG